MDNLEPVEEIVRATKAATDSARAKSASSKEKSQNKKSSKHKKERDVPVNKEDDTDVLLRKCENQEYSKLIGLTSVYVCFVLFNRIWKNVFSFILQQADMLQFSVLVLS